MTDTIVWGSFDSNPAMAAARMLRREAVARPPDADGASGLFRIRAADTAGRRSSANVLIQHRYAWRGYHVAALPEQQSAQRATLSAIDNDRTIGTITIGLDGEQGLYADDGFGDELDALRDAGWSLCEFTRLAIDSSVRSKRVLASLFHVAYVYAHHIQHADMLVIEVNPRHVRFYMEMLGCRVLGAERMNNRVKAPAVLLCVEFAHIRRQISRFGGRAAQFPAERSLYPHAFSAHEEAGILERLRRPSHPRGRAAAEPTRQLSMTT